MTTSTQCPVHREITPARQCPDCGAWLTSANREGEGCSLHGGWEVEKTAGQQARDDRAELYAEIEAVMSA